MKNYFLNSAAHVPMSQTVIDEIVRVNNSLAGHGHPLSPCLPGRQASFVIEECRNKLTEMIGAKNSNQIYFTNGATSACEWAIQMLLSIISKQPTVSSIEHTSIFEAVKNYCGLGPFWLKNDENGCSYMPPTKVDAVVCLHVQNELGVIQPLKGLKKHCSFLLSDMSQSLGKMPINVKELGVDLAIFNSHKFGGPSGISFIYLENNSFYEEYGFGTGSHYYHDVPGTLSASLIAGMTIGLAEALDTLDERRANMCEFQAVFETGLKELGCEIVGEGAPRLYGITYAKSPKDMGGVDLLIKLAQEGIHIGLGSACGQITVGPSRLLKALGRDDDGQNYFRISQWGEYKKEDAVFVLDKIKECING